MKLETKYEFEIINTSKVELEKKENISIKDKIDHYLLTRLILFLD